MGGGGSLPELPRNRWVERGGDVPGAAASTRDGKSHVGISSSNRGAGIRKRGRSRQKGQ